MVAPDLSAALVHRALSVAVVLESSVAAQMTAALVARVTPLVVAAIVSGAQVARLVVALAVPLKSGLSVVVALVAVVVVVVAATQAAASTLAHLAWEEVGARSYQAALAMPAVGPAALAAQAASPCQAQLCQVLAMQAAPLLCQAHSRLALARLVVQAGQAVVQPDDSAGPAYAEAAQPWELLHRSALHSRTCHRPPRHWDIACGPLHQTCHPPKRPRKECHR